MKLWRLKSKTVVYKLVDSSFGNDLLIAALGFQGKVNPATLTSF